MVRHELLERSHTNNGSANCKCDIIKYSHWLFLTPSFLPFLPLPPSPKIFNYTDRMEFDSMHLQDHLSLQRDGILKKEILSPSNIMDIYLPPRNPNSQPSIAWDPIYNGKMLLITGKNRNPSLKVTKNLSFLRCKMMYLLFQILQSPRFGHPHSNHPVSQKDFGRTLRIEGPSSLNLLSPRDLILWISKDGRKSPFLS